MLPPPPQQPQHHHAPPQAGAAAGYGQQPPAYQHQPPHHHHQQHHQPRPLRDVPGLSPYELQLLAAQNITSVRDVLTQSALDLCERCNVPLSTAAAILQRVSLEAAPSFTTALELHTTLHQHSVTLLTGLPALDDALRIGLPPAAITELVGPAGVGKSQFCYGLALQAAMPRELGGLAATLVYVDTEGKFSSERLQEMVASRLAAAPPDAVAAAAAAGAVATLPEQPAADADDVVDQVLNRVLVVKPHSPEELQSSLAQLALMVPQRDVRLIILDSIAALLRTADLTGGGGGASGGDGGPAALAARGEALGQAASVLKAVAESNRIPVVVTNQVTARMTGPAVHAFQQQQQQHPGHLQQQQPEGVAAALGTKWAHAVNVRLVLERRGEQRFIMIAKSPLSANVAVEYCIKACGVQQPPTTHAGGGPAAAVAPQSTLTLPTMNAG